MESVREDPGSRFALLREPPMQAAMDMFLVGAIGVVASLGALSRWACAPFFVQQRYMRYEITPMKKLVLRVHSQHMLKGAWFCVPCEAITDVPGGAPL